MISDAEVARALGWTQQEVPVRVEIKGQIGEEIGLGLAPFVQQVKKWHDENGQHHPLRPFTESYDVVMDEAKKRGLNVAFRSDSDVVFVWTGEDKGHGTYVQGLPLVEGFCIAMLHQLGRLDRLPIHIKQAALRRISNSNPSLPALNQETK